MRKPPRTAPHPHPTPGHTHTQNLTTTQSLLSRTHLPAGFVLNKSNIPPWCEHLSWGGCPVQADGWDVRCTGQLAACTPCKGTSLALIVIDVPSKVDTLPLRLVPASTGIWGFWANPYAWVTRALVSLGRRHAVAGSQHPAVASAACAGAACQPSSLTPSLWAPCRPSTSSLPATGCAQTPATRGRCWASRC